MTKVTRAKSVTPLGGVGVLMDNGRLYVPNVTEFVQTPGEYPELEISCTLSPQNLATNYSLTPIIENVIFNPPATIVFWSDHTKTVVKCDYSQDPYDPEKGLAMAISKKLLGENKYDYYYTFLHWLKKWEPKKLEVCKMPDPTDWTGDMCDA